MAVVETVQQKAAKTRAANNGGVHPGGRPQSYKPEYCETVIALGREGKSQAQMAAHFDVAKATITEWSHQHPEFLNALARARTFAQAWWENAAQTGLENREFNAALWHKSVASRFRDDYTDKTEQTVTGSVKIQWGKSAD